MWEWGSAGSSRAGAGQPIKLRRSRQRVDAGEPRNSYPSPRAAMSSSPFSALPVGGPFNAFLASNPQLNAFYRLQQQALLSSTAVPHSQASPTSPAPASPAGTKDERNGNLPKPCLDCTDKDAPNGELKAEAKDPEAPAAADDEGDEDGVAAKRSRVEHIISSMGSPPGSPAAADTDPSNVSDPSTDQASHSPSDNSPKSKRKSYQPQKEVSSVSEGLDQDPQKDKEDKALDEAEEKEPMVNRVQELLELQRRQYCEWYAQQQKKAEAGAGAGAGALGGGMGTPVTQAPPSEDWKAGLGGKELKGLTSRLKAELVATMSGTVERIMKEFVEAEAGRLANQMRAAEASRQRSPYMFNPYAYAYAAQSLPGPAGLGGALGGGLGGASIFPASSQASPGPFASLLPSQRSEAGLLAKRKRSKVTDTRLVGRAAGLGLGKEERGSPGGYYPPTMVGHPLYGATLSGLGLEEGVGREEGASPAFSDDVSYESAPNGDPSIPQSATLTPMHLRKAKLMFFFTRYPSSTLIKTYFPDIRFNKNTTAQLVKWFSNFREFYYIQMEKYARQAMAEGTRRPEEIRIGLDSDLYKTLNQHYNRNNHIAVPPEFRDVVEATLREFFLAIQAGKDAEASWKKQIYKVIARLDMSIPDYFKNPHFLDQLE